MTIRGRAIAGAGHIDCSVGLSHGSKEGGTLDFGLTMHNGEESGEQGSHNFH